MVGTSSPVFYVVNAFRAGQNHHSMTCLATHWLSRSIRCADGSAQRIEGDNLCGLAVVAYLS